MDTWSREGTSLREGGEGDWEIGRAIVRGQIGEINICWVIDIQLVVVVVVVVIIVIEEIRYE